MNAPNAFSQDRIAAERKAYEPSMEEILASIRRIIADDQALPPHSAEAAPVASIAPAAAAPILAPVAAAAAPLDEDDNSLDGWTDLPAAAAPKPAPAPEPVAPAPPPLRSGFDFVPGREFRPMPSRVPAPEPSRAPAPERPVYPREPVTPRANAEPAPVERRESQRRIAPGPRPAPQPQPPQPAAEEALISPATDAMVANAFNTLIASRFLQSNDLLGEMVRDMLRPMLKAWLDDNLPILVERLVRAEIERVARGGR
jgi:uncharacterized protein